MFHVVFSVLCLIFMVAISVHSEKNCDTLGILIYEDLGCKVIKKDDRGCPIQYQCDDFSRKNNSCLFRGKTYVLREKVDDDLTYGSCSVDCGCEDSDGVTKFVCAELDCPEWNSPVKPDCSLKFAVDKCCPEGVICSSEDNPLAKCNVNGKDYIEGQLIYPENTCFECVCGKNWTGKFEAPFCKRSLCISQIHKEEELHNKCAPCYFNREALCCPDTWVCPSPSDQITKINNVNFNSELTCVFGSKTLKLGEGFQTKVDHHGTEKNVQCECAVPPLLTCKGI